MVIFQILYFKIRVYIFFGSIQSAVELRNVYIIKKKKDKKANEEEKCNQELKMLPTRLLDAYISSYSVCKWEIHIRAITFCEQHVSSSDSKGLNSGCTE